MAEKVKRDPIGRDFEEEFANYLIKHCGYEKKQIRVTVSAKDNYRGTNVDVIAYRVGDKGKKFKKLAKVYISIVLLVIAYALIANPSTDDALFKISLMFGLGGILALILSKKYDVEHAWVECKNRKDKATIEMVRKMNNEYDAYIKTGDRNYKFKEKYFVSANGFVDNAIKLAIEKNIKCYIKDKNKFRKITEWD